MLATLLGELGLGIACALLGAGPRPRRAAAVLLAIVGAGLPWGLPREQVLARAILALAGTWGVFRAIDLYFERAPLPWRRRVWHLFGIIDTRQAVAAPRRVDGGALAAVLGYAALGAVSLWLTMAVASRLHGASHFLLRWGAGAIVMYAMADTAGAATMLLYRAAGYEVPLMHRVPLASSPT